MTKQFNIGFLGASRIARKFASDAKCVQSAKLYAAAARNLESAETFAQEYDMACSYGSYEELVNDENVDIIYISTPNSLHKEHVILCLEAGKAVICEKPFALNVQEVQEMIQIAQDKNVFLMEAMWTRYLPSINRAKAWIDEGKIGNIKMFQGDFGFKSESQDDIRFQKALGGGALLDVGIYPVSLASFIFGKQPDHIEAKAVLTEQGVDETIAMQFIYGKGQMAQLNASINLCTPRNAYIIGENGYIHLPGAWYGKLAYLYNSEGKLIEHFVDQSKELGYNFELEEVINCLTASKTESDRMRLQESLEITQTLDAIRNIIGVKYSIE
ncbi:Gfo/Idh/MocA family protein [Cellulosilyticum sp. I15G10I2]|uniref:Gfo/Idh/MocA family protein n=1 Tax=Cellulosilyticum sp. I15G10I2 TaxID=1892843 RepID=UPI00085C8229|nr:Gfo/Idh/MocA family oxidoreductase [Cellulosilyticum sp. I15G10I2]